MQWLLAITQVTTRRNQAAEHSTDLLYRRGIWNQLPCRREFEFDLPIGMPPADKISRLNVDAAQLRIPPEELDKTPPDLVCCLRTETAVDAVGIDQKDNPPQA